MREALIIFLLLYVSNEHRTDSLGCFILFPQQSSEANYAEISWLKQEFELE